MTSDGGKTFAYVDRDGSEFCVYSGENYAFLLGSADSEATAKYLCGNANAAHAARVKVLVEALEEIKKTSAKWKEGQNTLIRTGLLIVDGIADKALSAYRGG